MGGREVNEVLSVLPNKAIVGVTSWPLKESSSWMTSSNTTIFGKSSHADCVCPQTMALLTGHSLLPWQHLPLLLPHGRVCQAP